MSFQFQQCTPYCQIYLDHLRLLYFTPTNFHFHTWMDISNLLHSCSWGHLVRQQCLPSSGDGPLQVPRKCHTSLLLLVPHYFDKRTAYLSPTGMHAHIHPKEWHATHDTPDIKSKTKTGLPHRVFQKYRHINIVTGLFRESGSTDGVVQVARYGTVTSFIVSGSY